MSQELEEKFGEIDFVNDDDRGAQNLHEWLKFSPNVKALVNSVMPEFQEIHDAQKDVYATINISEAVGTQLDDIFGNLLDVERETGASDNEYRTILLGRTTVLNKSGDIITMKGLYRNLVSATSISLIEYNPATFIMNAQVPVVNDVDVTNVRSELVKAKQGGNELALTLSIDTTPFSFISVGDTPDPTLGFSSLSDPTSGGTLGSLIPKVIVFTFLTTDDDKFLTTDEGKKLIFFEGV